MYVLTVTQGPDKGRDLEMETGKTYTVGCEEEAALRLTDPMVLKGHCSIEVHRDHVIIRNHTASAGTFVGDKKIAQAKVSGSAMLKVGETTLSLKRVRRRVSSKPDPLIGKIIGGYKLNEVVGRGGMGTVYRATQLSLQRDVALKVLSAELSKDKAFRDLFIHEAQAAAQLVDPNIVQVYDAGIEGSVSFFSMEFIGQGSVEEILEREKKLEWKQAILWVLEAAHGLKYAESRGIVHRDIKPDNLMLNDDGRIKIADLGLAKRGETSDSQGVIGTPHFIPPEQALGKEVDTRADIYSLGATFFRLITGRTLFTGKTAKEIVLKHIKEPPPAASSVEDDVPGELDMVLARMLAKDPDDRYQNTAELIAALEEVCAHHGIKGAIIKKGVGKKVLIPLILLLIAGGFVIYKLATRKVEQRDNPELIAKQKAAEAEARRRRAEAARANREKMLADARAGWNELRGGRWKLESEIPLRNVYDEDATRAEYEAKWKAVAKEYQDFADLDLAVRTEDELGYATKAKKTAKEILRILKKDKATAAEKQKKIAAKKKEAASIEKAQRTKLAELRVARRYHAAANLCEEIASAKKGADPFGDLISSEIEYGDEKMSVSNLKSVTQLVDKAREYFRAEREEILRAAEADWKAVQKKVDAFGPETTDAQIEAILKELDAVLDNFYDPAAERTVKEIKPIISEAGKERRRWNSLLEKRRLERVQGDRALVSHTQRRLCSLDPAINPNRVMQSDFAGAIDEWNRVLPDIKTERYQAFARERIQMLRWCECLYKRFHDDWKLSVTRRDPAQQPFRSLDLELPIPGTPRTLSTELYKPEEGRYDIFVTKKRLKGKTEFRFSNQPMDWIHNVLFFHGPNPRWKVVPPYVRFALGAFCFETMQYKRAEEHFTKLLGDKEYGDAAKALAARAKLEAAAKKEWLDICRAALAPTSVAEVKALQARVDAFRGKFEGTMFYLDAMAPNTTLTRDFGGGPAMPDLPKAPSE